MGNRETDDANEWCDHEVMQEVGAGDPECDSRDLANARCWNSPMAPKAMTV